jgi:arylsulfatase A-like enzyme
MASWMRRVGTLVLTTGAILALALTTIDAQSTSSATANKKPNIVFILTDNLGYGELGVYGGGILRGAPTPRIDKLASEGTRLLNFNVEAQCTPSRSALMTGRFSIRSGTYEVPIGGAPDGLTLWEITIAQLLSAQGYATGMWGKWHLGSIEARLPMNRGFDEWYGIPRTYDEAMWPSLNETKSMWPSVGDKQGWDPKLVHAEPIYEGRKGEKARVIGELNVDNRRTMEAEITTRAVEFIKRNASEGKPFYAYVASSMVHMPTLPNLDFAGKTGNGDWADCLAEMDYRTGQILDAIKEAGIEDNTIVVFTSDNGLEATDPWEGDSGPWRGTYFTAMEASLRTPFIIRWPGKVPAGRVSNEIVHIVDMYPTLAHIGGAEVPKDRPIDGVDQLDFFLGKQENSNRKGFPAYVADRLSAVKWRNWKMHLIWQENMYDPPQRLPVPKLVNLLTNLKEERDVGAKNSWAAS